MRRALKPSTDSGLAYSISTIKTANADADRRTADQVAALLALDDRPPLGPLATRDNYPAAARALAAVIGDAHAVTVLVADSPFPNVTLWRCASVAGAWQRSARMPPRDLADQLRAKGDEPSRVALALAGEPVAPWPQMCRRERAAVLLRDLVAAMRATP